MEGTEYDEEYYEDQYIIQSPFDDFHIHVEHAFHQLGVIPEDADFQEIYTLLGTRKKISFLELLEIVDDYVITQEVDFERRFKRLK